MEDDQDKNAGTLPDNEITRAIDAFLDDPGTGVKHEGRTI
jgi:hypothetical protein